MAASAHSSLSSQDDDRKKRRSVERRGICEGAYVEFAGGSVPCVVRDISDTGARVEFARAYEVPDRFTLLIGGRMVKGRSAWKSVTELGVTFDSAPRPVVPMRMQAISASTLLQQAELIRSSGLLAKRLM